MPALQRTPPQRAARSPAKPYAPSPRAAAAASEAIASPASAPAPSRTSEGNSTLPSPSRAFIPRNQKVMRTPPGGSSSSMAPPPVPPLTPSASSSAPNREREVKQDTDMFVEERIAAGTSTAPTGSIYPSAEPSVEVAPVGVPPVGVPPVSTTPRQSPQKRKSTTPAHSPSKPLVSTAAEAGPSQVPTAAATPAPRTPRTRRSVAPVPVNDPLPVMEVDEASQWGKRYEITYETLQLAIKNAACKWTKKDLLGIFPLLAAKFPQELAQIYTDASTSMQTRIETEAKSLFEHYKVGRAMQMLDAVVKDAKDYAASNTEGRPDAWRPDLSPEALTAAANLGLYDETYERLRTEYLALHADCSTRFSSIQAKQAQLAELESSVADSVAGLDQTLQTLDGFPTGEMKDWAETTMGRMEGGRVVEKA